MHIDCRTTTRLFGIDTVYTDKFFIVILTRRIRWFILTMLQLHSHSKYVTNQYLTFSAKTWPRNGLSNVTHFMVSRYPVTLCRCKGRLGYRNVFFVGFWSLCHFYYSSSRQADSSRQAFKTSGWNVCTERRRRRRRRTEEDCRRK